ASCLVWLSTAAIDGASLAQPGNLGAETAALATQPAPRPTSWEIRSSGSVPGTNTRYTLFVAATPDVANAPQAALWLFSPPDAPAAVDRALLWLPAEAVAPVGDFLPAETLFYTQLAEQTGLPVAVLFPLLPI